MMRALGGIVDQLEDELGTTPHLEITLVHGDARGADRMSERLLRYRVQFYIERYPADWEKHGKRAGPIRNQEMVDLGADVCLAFFKNGAVNRGTSDCVRRAEKAGIPVRKFYG